MTVQSPRVNTARLLDSLRELASIGKNEAGGIDRQLGSPADSEARAWLTQYWQGMGLAVRTDAIANLWAEQGKRQGKPIVLGSHHDTVPNGGAYDGALGVLMATEVVRTLQESGIKLSHPLAVLSFTGEEPNDFSVSTLGSKVLCGRLGEADLMQLKHRVTGESLEQAIKRLGGDIHRVGQEALLSGDELAAFLECHIEQGRRLYDAGEKIAAVTCITGIYREYIRVFGEANHAGTTRLKDRRDALAAAAEVVCAVENLMKEPALSDLAVTVGQIEVKPNASNIVPGFVELSLDLRTADPEERKLALAKLGESVAGIEKRRGVRIERQLDLDQKEMPMAPAVIRAVNEAAARLDEPQRELVSMAGHDAANMARFTKSGMLFVSTVDGYSHCPREAAPEEAVAVAAQAMLEAVLLLDGSLV